MNAKIIDGKAIATQEKAKIRKEAELFNEKFGRQVGLAVIIVGEDPASKIYVNNKIKACEETGIRSFSYRLPESVSDQDVINLIEELNENEAVDGLLVQVPLPKHLNEQKILSHITVNKDVDGFCATNVGNLLLSRECNKACTPAGIITLIESTGVNICGKHAVVIGRSNTVGKPVALMLLEKNATVTVCHSKTENLAEVCKTADVLVCAVGRKHIVTADMVKEGAIVIDVGMNRVDGKLYGDVDFENVSKVAGYITPVPGGVGPMTVTMLLKNTVKVAYRGK